MTHPNHPIAARGGPRHPDKAPAATERLTVGARLLRAILGGSPALDIVREARRAKHEDRSVARLLARLLTEQGAGAYAAPYWHRLRELDPADIEACFHCARLELGGSGDVEGALDRVCDGPARGLRPVLSRVLRAPILSITPADCIRHIAICGVSFCGSTLLDRVMAGLPGVRSIGESHWLTKTYKDKVASPIDFSEPNPTGVPQCAACGSACEYLTLDFRSELAADRTNWYFKIAKRLGTTILVSADKNPPKLAELDPLLRMDAVVLFKSPAQAWSSHLDKLPKARDPGFYRMEIEKYILQWCRSYETFLDDFRPLGEVLFVSFDDFTREPERVMRAICAQLGLIFDETVLTKTVPGHAVGGNTRAIRRLRDNDYAIEVIALAETAISAEDAARLDGDERMNAIHEQLRHRYHGLMSDDAVRPLSVARPLVDRLAAPTPPARAKGEGTAVQEPAPRKPKLDTVATAPDETAVANTGAAAPVASPAPVREVASAAAKPIRVKPVGERPEAPRPAAPRAEARAATEEARPAPVIRQVITPFPMAKVGDVHRPAIFGDLHDNLRAHIAHLEGARHPNDAIKLGFFQHLLATIDSDDFAALQRTYVTPDQGRISNDRLKYLNLVHWLDAKLNAVIRINLHRMPSSAILDLGTGPGHFPAIAKYFGHQVLGTDLPLKPDLPSQERHLYDALCELYGIRKVAHRIHAFEELPDFGERFDIVTAFMAAFNVLEDRSPWPIEAWKFFFASVKRQFLKPGGKIYFQLTNGKITDEVWAYVTSGAVWSHEKSRWLYIENIDNYVA